MLIQNLLYRPGNNGLQEAGRLDEQIAHDFRALAQSLRDYQTRHLDAKCQGRTNHYEKWTAENTLKIAYADRVAQLAEAAAAGQSPPANIGRDAWYAMHPLFREPLVLSMALRETAAIRPYLRETVYVERQSLHADDWYLWSVAACRDSDQGRVWDCWTLNLTTGGMNGGHYGLSYEGLKSALAAKKGITQCDPERCPYDAHDKEVEDE